MNTSFLSDQCRQLHAMYLTMALACFATSCSGSAEPRDDGKLVQPVSGFHVSRDIVELEKIERTPRSCERNTDCPIGSHCDNDKEICKWECLSDTDCEQPAMCTELGSCVARPPSLAATRNAGDTSDACQGLPPDTAALLTLNDQARRCANGDAGCPCGSYCDISALCHVDCIAGDDPPDGFACGDGKACTPLGRCDTVADAPPPLVQALTLQMSPAGASANTASAAVLIPITVSATANSLDFVRPNHPARVRYHVQSNAPPPSSDGTGGVGSESDSEDTTPRVKCALDAPLTPFCDLDGGWVFHIGSGTLISDPRTIWVEVPQKAAVETWILEAHSEWALTSATIGVSARPLSVADSSTGRYTGIMTLPDFGDGVASKVRVEAIVTSTRLALLDPTRALLPDGHAVIAIDDKTRTTMLRWLNSGIGPNPQYNVRVELSSVGNVTLDPVTGHYEFPLAFYDGMTASPGKQFQVSLQHTGGLPSACPANGCEFGSYCEPAMNLCIAGTGPAPGPGIVGRSTAVASSLMSSVQYEAWNSRLQTVVQSNPTQFPTGANVDSFYCYQSPQQQGPAGFGDATQLQEPSKDLGCIAAGVGGVSMQNTFSYVNRRTEVVRGDQGTKKDVVIFNLLKTCLDDLQMTPDGRPTTAASLLDARQCVSLGRVFLSMFGGGTTEQEERKRWQVFRQWLALSAFIANSAVQTQHHDDAEATSQGSASERLGSVLDIVEQNLQIMFAKLGTPDATSMLSRLVVPSPDYRATQRPLARWTFNGPSSSASFGTEPDAEAGPAGGASLSWTNGSPFDGALMFASPTSTCLAQPAGLFAFAPSGTSDNEYFTIMGNFSFFNGSQSGTIVLFDESAPNGDGLMVTASWVRSGSIEIKVTDKTGRFVRFEPILGVTDDNNQLRYGFIAIVNDGGNYRLAQSIDGRLGIRGAITESSLDKPRWGEPGTLRLGCTPYTGASRGSSGFAYLIWDEVSFWNRAVSPEELAAMAVRYNNSGLNETLPPKNSPPLPGNEQAAGLPVALIEAASADLNLLGAYVGAERTSVYMECLANTSVARNRMVERAGRNLRTVALTEHRAAELARVPGVSTAAWFPRYQADLTELAGKRTSVLAALQSVIECKNPLGIEEEDLPLYVGSVGGNAQERFFAGSRFLASMAEKEIKEAADHLEKAREQYRAQQTSEFQEREVDHNKDDRIRKLSVDYEGVLRRFCGAPPGDGQPLLDGLRNGTIDADNCHIKSERPECEAAVSKPFMEIPSDCLRGEIGERWLQMQAAQVDIANAKNAYNRAVEVFDAQAAYCGALKDTVFHNEDMALAHIDLMRLLHKEAIAIYADDIADAGSDERAMGIIISGVFAQQAANIQFAAEEANAFYELFRALGDGQLEVSACLLQAENQKSAYRAASDTIVRALKTVEAAAFNVRDDREMVAGIASEADGQIAIESTIDRTPPHLHFFLDQDISSFQRHMAYARRLTYLAVRGFEYESQQSSPWRTDVLNARLPDDLTSVVTDINKKLWPFQGTRTIDQGPLVLSLRDEILHIADLSANTTRLPGDPPMDPIAAFKLFLSSDASKIYDRAGNFKGRGIRFSLRPGEQNANSCSERVFRIAVSVQVDNQSRAIGDPRLVLSAANSFSSQMCKISATEPPLGTLQVSRIQPSNALLVGDSSHDFMEPRPFSSTNIFALVGKSRETLSGMTFPPDDTSAFAGRGYFADYIIMFPNNTAACTPSHCDGWSPEALASVTDILLRFDIVEVNNTDL